MKNCSLMFFYSEITYSKSPKKKKKKKNYKIIPKLTTKAPNIHQLTSAKKTLYKSFLLSCQTECKLKISKTSNLAGEIV